MLSDCALRHAGLGLGVCVAWWRRGEQRDGEGGVCSRSRVGACVGGAHGRATRGHHTVWECVGRVAERM